MTQPARDRAGPGVDVLESHPAADRDPRVRRAVVASVLALLAVLLGVGIGFGLPVTSAAPRPPATRTVDDAPPPVLPGLPNPYFRGDLRTLLVGPPPGVTPTRGQGAADFTMTIQQAGAYYAVNGEVYLGTLHFLQGASWSWTTGGSTVLVILLRFETEAEAFTWKASDQSEQAGDPRISAQGDIAAIAGARYSVQTKLDSVVARVYLSRNDIGAIVRVESAIASPVPLAESLARSQYGKLP